MTIGYTAILNIATEGRLEDWVKALLVQEIENIAERFEGHGVQRIAVTNVTEEER